MDFTSQSGAIISACEKYRYVLWRNWDDGEKVLFIMLNPSTADARNDDATIRRCIGFAKNWGYSGIAVVNLFAQRSKNFDDLRNSRIDPIGPENDEIIEKIHRKFKTKIAAWGNNGSHLGRSRNFIGKFENLYALELTEKNEPKHPLYINGNTKPKRITISDTGVWSLINEST